MCWPVLDCCNLIFLAFGRHPTDVVLLEGDAVVGGTVVQNGGKSRLICETLQVLFVDVVVMTVSLLPSNDTVA
jgi:hypothetical protein